MKFLFFILAVFSNQAFAGKEVKIMNCCEVKYPGWPLQSCGSTKLYFFDGDDSVCTVACRDTSRKSFGESGTAKGKHCDFKNGHLKVQAKNFEIGTYKVDKKENGKIGIIMEDQDPHGIGHGQRRIFECPYTEGKGCSWYKNNVFSQCIVRYGC